MILKGAVVSWSEPARPKRRSLGARVIAISLIAAVASRATAQDGGIAEKILELNRRGKWSEAASLAKQSLADQSSLSDSGPVCSIRAELVYALTRLKNREAAYAELSDFDDHCSNSKIDVGMTAEISQLRRVLATGMSDSIATEPAGNNQRSSSNNDAFWRVGDPVALGMNAKALDEHRALCQRTGADACLVVFRGQIVQEWYSDSYRRPAYAMSTTKSITGILVGLLVDDGRIQSLDETVCGYISLWCTGIRRMVTVRHLLTMTSGLPRMRDSGVGFVRDKDPFVIHLSPTSQPGSVWSYSNEGAQLLSPILDRAAGEPIQKYAQRRLFNPIGMADTRLHLDDRQHAWTYADMETTPRDLARVGLLMLNNGKWRGRQIVSKRWVESSTRPSQKLNPDYGLLWWLHDDPPGFAGHGHLDTDLHIFPTLGLVVIRMQAKPVPGVPEGTYDVQALPIFKTMVSRR